MQLWGREGDGGGDGMTGVITQQQSAITINNRFIMMMELRVKQSGIGGGHLSRL